jgi:hypothetical protein
MQPKKRRKKLEIATAKTNKSITINKKKNKRYQATIEVPSSRSAHHHENNLTQ